MSVGTAVHKHQHHPDVPTNLTYLFEQIHRGRQLEMQVDDKVDSIGARLASENKLIGSLAAIYSVEREIA
jgi:hypothetical protein